jgi:hypothetical protein
MKTTGDTGIPASDLDVDSKEKKHVCHIGEKIHNI